MSAHKIVFLSYSVRDEVSIMGLIKRCLRILDRLPRDRCRPYLVHSGWVPDDPLTRRILDTTEHVISSGCVDDRVLFSTVLADIEPDSIVCAEPPLVSGMRKYLGPGPRLLCIENFFSEDIPEHHVARYPDVDGWLFLGLPATGGFGPRGPRSFLAPPLLPARPQPSSRDIDVLIQGYDIDVARFGLELLDRLGRSLRATILIGPTNQALLGSALERPDLEVVRFPEEATYQSILSRARVVIGKDGFQQIVEALAVGTPVICRASPGGVGQVLPDHIMRYVHFSAEPVPDWARIGERLPQLIEPGPPMPWAGALARIESPCEFAAAGIEHLVIQARGRRSR